MENILAHNALESPQIIPKVYWASNLKIMYMPSIVNNPVKISTFEIFWRLITGSRTAVNKVNEDRHTIATETVDDFIDWKNKIQ
jgi:hypothetical protein